MSEKFKGLWLFLFLLVTNAFLQQLIMNRSLCLGSLKKQLPKLRKLSEGLVYFCFCLKKNNEKRSGDEASVYINKEACLLK